VLKSLLYRGLRGLAGVFFNVLTVLLAGNLPPFGCVCVIIEDQDRYLVIERPEGGYVFPGGFMRWREHPAQTASREGREETGLQLQISRLIGMHSFVTEHIALMSTLTLIFQAKVVGGELKSSIEGQPCWRSPEELPHLLQQRQQGVLESFLQYRAARAAEDEQEAH
jgi:ADP-ribose pyrophosphatase YjhB (NUDIX family)